MKTMKKVSKAEAKANPSITLTLGEYFKIRDMYFQIERLTPDGFAAKGVSRKEYLGERTVLRARSK